MTICPIYKNFFNKISELKIHLTIVHLYEKGTLLVCRESATCSRVFDDFLTFRKHLTTSHKSMILNNISNEDNQINIQNNVKSNGQDNALDNNKIDEEHPDNDFVPIADPIDDNESIDSIYDELSFEFLKFVGKQCATYKLPTNYVQNIVDDVTNIVESITTKMKRLLIFDLKQNGVNTNEASTSIDRTGAAMLKVLKTFRTHHRRLQMLKESDYLVPVEQDIVGDRIDDRRRKGIIMKVIVPVYASYLSISFTLQKLFNKPGVFSAAKKHMQKLEDEKELLQNFIQGKLWKRKVAKFYRGKFVIPLFLYFDDFEVNNVLGSHAGYKKNGFILQ